MEKEKNERFSVSGMSCAACSAHVEKAVKEVPGVKGVAVSLLTNSMEVSFDASCNQEDIVKAVRAAGYGASPLLQEANDETLAREKEFFTDRETPRLVKRLIVSFVLLIPLFYLSMGHAVGWPIGILGEDHLSYGLVAMLLSLAIMLVNGRFFVSGSKALWHRAPNMDTLVALGSSVAFLYSLVLYFEMAHFASLGDLARLASLSKSLSFETAGMVPALIAIGKTLESYAKGKTTSSLRGLIDLAPKKATLLDEGKETAVRSDSLKKGDLVLVRPGESFPADGTVDDGESAVDESSLSGESVPVEKSPGSPVFCATINQSGALRVRVEKVGADMTLSQIVKTVKEASLGKTKAMALADKVSGVFVPTIMAASLVVFVFWLIFGGDFVSSLGGYSDLLSYSLERGVSVLVVACPCALGLATPVAIMVGGGKGARSGILFKTASALEEAGKARFVVFDKTGTLTKGRMKVTDLVSYSSDNLLEFAASLESLSEHPLGKAIVDEAATKGLERKACSSFRAVSGSGAEGTIEGHRAYGGNYAFMEKAGIADEAARKEGERLSQGGKTALYFAKDGKIIGIVALRDVLRDDSVEAVRAFKGMGLTPILLSGDNRATAASIARDAGIGRFVAEADPIKKREAIAELQRSGKTIMVGDGINDAPSLTQADIGIAIGAGSDIAIDSADVVLVNSSLMDAYRAVNLSRIVFRIVKENLFWAFFYNIVMIPIAAGALSFAGVYKLRPWYGSAAMALSSLTVALNALRINLYRLGKTHKAVLGRKKEAGERAAPLGEAVVLRVEGMMCEHCAERVRSALMGVPGLSDVQVSLEKKEARFVSDPKAVKKAVSAVRKAGYRAEKEQSD
ncbi:MAG: heavy metal translocating P-type ATPase [Bacilli bacterium]|jgi:Cu2+-exporting ATPase|nr:heavy metal translocating P-type ATPase [Bacilli bacterium]